MLERPMTEIERRAALALELYTQFTSYPWQIRRLYKAAYEEKPIPVGFEKYLWRSILKLQKRIKDPELVNFAVSFQVKG